MTGFLFNDAAPRASEASVSNLNVHGDLTRLSLEPPAHRNAPPGTSSVAARRIRAHAPTQRAEVLEVVARSGEHGATGAEIESALPTMSPHSVSPRLNELRTLGLIVNSGRKRNTPSGRPATVSVPRTALQEGGAA